MISETNKKRGLPMESVFVLWQDFCPKSISELQGGHGPKITVLDMVSLRFDDIQGVHGAMYPPLNTLVHTRIPSV